MINQIKTIPTHGHYVMGDYRCLDVINPDNQQLLYGESVERLKKTNPEAEVYPLPFIDFCIEEVAEMIFKEDPKIISEAEWKHYLNVMPPDDYQIYDLEPLTQYTVLKLGSKLFSNYTKIFIKVDDCGDIWYYEMSDLNTLSVVDVIHKLKHFLTYGRTKQKVFAINYINHDCPNNISPYYTPRPVENITQHGIIHAPCCAIANTLDDQQFFEAKSPPKIDNLMKINFNN